MASSLLTPICPSSSPSQAAAVEGARLATLAASRANATTRGANAMPPPSAFAAPAATNAEYREEAAFASVHDLVHYAIISSPAQRCARHRAPSSSPFCQHARRDSNCHAFPRFRARRENATSDRRLHRSTRRASLRQVYHICETRGRIAHKRASERSSPPASSPSRRPPARTRPHARLASRLSHSKRRFQISRFPDFQISRVPCRSPNPRNSRGARDERRNAWQTPLTVFLFPGLKKTVFPRFVRRQTGTGRDT